MFKSLIKKAWHSKSHINIGKQGLTEGVINEIRRRLKQEKVVKVRILKNCPLLTSLDRREAAKIVAEKVGAKLIGVRGYTFLLAEGKKFKE